ncbi:MAG: DUF2244 domain-containing protein [Gammaproteobacteria bacterium]|nr:DUF2244 domain-containing protein [Gammaproteobacteria bacterium]
MFATHFDGSGCNAQIVVRADQSLSWQGNLTVLTGLGVVIATIATGFAFVGLWMVVPFAGLELLAVAIGLYVTSRRLAHSEVISLSPRSVQVESGYRYPANSRRVRRRWARIDLHDGHSPAERSRLYIRSHGRVIEVGACLTDKEREKLARELRRLLAEQ